MAAIHMRDKFKHPSGICGAGWQDGKADNGEQVRAVRDEQRVDCPKCLGALHPGKRVSRHGRVTILFDPVDLQGQAVVRVRQDDGTELALEAPLMHVLGSTVKAVQNISEVMRLVALDLSHPDNGNPERSQAWLPGTS